MTWNDRRTWVKLAPPDWPAATEEGIRRQKCVDDFKRDGARPPNLAHPAHTHIIGTCGEFSFADRFGLPRPDFGTRGIPDPGYDFDTPIGRIDTKSARKPPTKFLPIKEGTLAKRPGADLYALLWCDDDAVWLAGWIWRLEVLQLPSVPNVYAHDPERQVPGRVAHDLALAQVLVTALDDSLPDAIERMVL